MKKQGMTYAGVGVDYGAMDPFKRAAQLAGRETAGNLERFGLSEVEWSRGESVYLVYDEVRDCYWGHTHEGLGTKNLVADSLAPLANVEYYYSRIAQCALAAGFNDAATQGVHPTTATMHLAVGNSHWFDNQRRSDALIQGWLCTCLKVECAWAGGETPTLRDIIFPNAAELSCSVYGIVEPASKLIGTDVQHGDIIVLLASSGIHANGLTMAREIAVDLPHGYLTQLENGISYGEALLEPTVLYGPIVEAILDRDVKIHYAVNITGHGWRKLMRSPKPMHYVIKTVPEPQPIFRFIQNHGNVEIREMYANFNMGAGFAVYVAKQDVATVIDVAGNFGVQATEAGFIDAGLRQRDDADEKKVIIEPIGIEFSGSTLGVR